MLIAPPRKRKSMETESLRPGGAGPAGTGASRTGASRTQERTEGTSPRLVSGPGRPALHWNVCLREGSRQGNPRAGIVSAMAFLLLWFLCQNNAQSKDDHLLGGRAGAPCADRGSASLRCAGSRPRDVSSVSRTCPSAVDLPQAGLAPSEAGKQTHKDTHLNRPRPVPGSAPGIFTPSLLQ